MKKMTIIGLMGMLLGACVTNQDPFNPKRIIEVNVELDPEQWDTLRQEGRNAPDALSGCAIDYEYSYFDATVTVDGETYDDVAIRKKGFLGSISAMRPSLKINFGKFVEDRTHAGMKRMARRRQQLSPTPRLASQTSQPRSRSSQRRTLRTPRGLSRSCGRQSRSSWAR